MSRGILLAGGTGSRLYPCTISVSKQLLNCAGKPLIFYPLCTLMEAGIRDICVITTEKAQDQFMDLLGNGKQFGMQFTWQTQRKPEGIAQAFVIARDFIGHEPVTLILGDNIFIGLDEVLYRTHTHPIGGNILAVRVANPERYGVASFDSHGKIKAVREKPKFTGSRWAVAGVYSFAPSVVEIAQGLRPSKRGELEIVDVIEEYCRRGQLLAHKLPPSATWLDCGTPEDLAEATNLITALENRSGEVIGSPEITALQRGFIQQEQFNELVRPMPSCRYRESLEVLCQKS